MNTNNKSYKQSSKTCRKWIARTNSTNKYYSYFHINA